jgi:hypothetical protein
MTYAQFVAAVVEEMGPDGVRRGITALRTRAIRDAVIDLQRFIRAYRTGHSTRYDVADLEAKSFAHVGLLPAQAKPKALYIISTGDTVLTGTTDDPECVRNRLDYVAWEDRRTKMICNEFGTSDYLYSISPFSTQFMVHPLINDETYLKIVWDGLKMTFADGDVVPWPEWAAEAVAAYVKAKISFEIDKRPDVARGWYDRVTQTGIYATLRRSLFREQQESQIANNRDEEYVEGDLSTPVPTILADFGGQDIPFLRLVTSLTGSATSLDAIPTVSLTVPFTVEVVIGGVLQTWQLISGTTATGPGVQRPADYAAGTNEKIWVQVS